LLNDSWERKISAMRLTKLNQIGQIKIGMIGGGQMAKMMTQAAKKMGFFVQILDPTLNCPAAQVADEQIVADFFDSEKLKELVLGNNVTTFDIERADKTLNGLVEKGYLIYPWPQIVEIIQDKIEQKRYLTKNNIPNVKYKRVEDSEITSAVKEFGFPVVQKACRGGYDGRGVFVIENEKDIEKRINSPSFLEEFIEIEKELAINIARSTRGEIKCHPVVEMIFDQRANICDMVVAPGRIKKEVKEEVERIGIETVKALGPGAVGIFGIEMFLSKDGRILVNEIAPRPHNSGHYTIEACCTSQFEQHIRAITGLSLGSTELLSPAVMVNILGEPKYEGPVVFEGIEKTLAIPGLSLHIYGKKITRPFRKMGHITVIDTDIEKAIHKAKMAKNLLKVKSKNLINHEN